MKRQEKHKHKSTYYNDIALRLLHKLYGVEYLHYGYFSKGLKPTIDNVPAAQSEYVKILLSYLPQNTKNVFDVGCGTGGIAKELLKKKCTVICLAPDPYLIEKTIENTKDRVQTIIDLYENVDHLPSDSFDMILMAESCQYIKIQEGWEQNRRFLKKGGYVLVGDFFRIKQSDRPNISKSGHPLEEYLKSAEEHGFKLIKKREITRQVAPTMEIYQSVISNKVFPVTEGIFEVFERKFPLTYKVLRRILYNKVMNLKEKYSNQGPELFKEYKGYYILLFRKSI